MRNIFLSVVVVVALAMAGIGGTLADFSDSEEEMGDILQAGSLDLKVNGMDDPDILPIAITGMIPDKWYDFTKTVANVGTIDGWLYLHVKNAVHTETNDKDLNDDGVIDGQDKPEPEIVAEQGGKHGQMMVPGIGELADMPEHIELQLWFGQGANLVQVDLSEYDMNGDGKVKLDEFECHQVLVAQLPACGDEYDVNFKFMLQDVPEEYYGIDLFDENDPHEVKWNWWPTNAMQGDTVTFDILFELLQTDYTPPGGS